MNVRQNFQRLQHRQLAERQRYLNDLESLVDRLRTDAQRLSGRIDEATASALTPQVHGVFVRPLVDRRDKLERSIAELDTQIVEAREAVVSAQQELKLVGSQAHRGLGPGENRAVRRLPRQR